MAKKTKKKSVKRTVKKVVKVRVSGYRVDPHVQRYHKKVKK